MISHPVEMPRRALSRVSAFASFPRVAALILMIAPGLFALVTFELHVDLQSQMRFLSVPIRLAELAIILVAMLDGFSLDGAFRKLSRVTRVAAVVWLGAVALSAFVAQVDPAAATVLAAGTLLHGVMALVLFDRIQTHNCGPALLRALGFGLAGYALVAVIAALLASEQADFDWPYFGVGVSNVRQIAFYGLPLIAIATGELMLGGRAARRASLGFMVTGLFLVIWSGGRASLLGAIATIGIVLLLTPQPVRREVLRTTGLAALLALPLAQLLSFSQYYGLTGIMRFVTQASGGDLNAYSSNRVQFWEWTYEAILRQPLIGHGEGQFGWMIVALTGQWYNHPHNVLLQWSYEWGLVGCAAFVFLLCRAILSVAANRKRWGGWEPACLAGVAGLFTTALLDGALYYPLPIVCAILFLAVSSADHCFAKGGAR